MAPGELLGEQASPSYPLLEVFYRRKRYDATVRRIAERKDGLFKDVPIDQTVALAFFSTPTLLDTFGPKNPDLPSLILRKYESDESNDLFHDWQLFCKTVNDHGKRSEYLLEGAIHFGLKHIPENWRQTWQLRGRELLQLLQLGRSMEPPPDDTQPVCHPSSNQGGDRPLEAEFPTVITSLLDTDSRFVAEMPDASLLRTVMGGFLYVGMLTSSKMMLEKQRLTGAVRLHAAAVSGGDFKLEVFVNSFTARSIAQANSGEDEKLLRDMLGDYLADGMESSLWRQEEKGAGITRPTAAVGLVNTEGEDYRLFLLLRFSTGQELFEYLFPI
ncbi:hypothetical protein CEP54_014255 [Fusarium duplospermum]|uniref:Uncharacterized protein n=1 Tax=Fusarium duplospermum TaxID=1325734 RepID=A0A428NXA3_9HYPO|nr:hypothetical protein CEP54_014255 [Fusarium duplospermum]